MKTFLKTSIFLAVILGGLGVACQSETSREEKNSTLKVQNLEAFARLYGYARWFHPSDEAQEIDWDKFAVLGVRKVENVQSTEELRDTLYKHDDSPLYLKGFEPDYPVRRTIRAVKEGRDEFLEKALEVARQEWMNDD